MHESGPGLMPPIEHATYVARSPGEVYRALSTGPGWDSWFTDGSTLDARPGGSYRFVWESFGPARVDLTLEGPVIDAVPGERFCFDWKSGEGTTRVAITLERRGEGAVVRVREEGYSWSEADVRSCLECAAGWGEALTLLKFHLEHGVRYGAVPSA